MNWHPDNLEWRTTLNEVRAKNRARTLKSLQASSGEYLQLGGHPHLWVKSDGSLWRMISSGDLRVVPGSMNGNQVRVSINSNRGPRSGQKIVSLKELVADVWLQNRPSLFHRAKLKDGNPWNTHPHNLEWYLPTNGRPIKHTFAPASKVPKDPTPDGRRREIRTIVDESWTTLLQMGARPMKGYPALWAMPSGRIMVLDAETGHQTYPIPDITGTVKACGLTIRARDFIADAFASTRYAPHLPYPRNVTQTAKCQDGNAENLHPSNLEWTQCTGKPHQIYSFESNPYDNDP